MGYERILITGGTGYVGKCILDYRLRHPEFLADTDLVLLSRTPERFKARNLRLLQQPGLAFLKGDVRDFEVSGGYFDAIVNAASPVQGAASDAEIMSANIEGSKRVLQLAASCGTRRILFTSSGAVYGRKTRPIREDDVCSPTSAYGHAKLAAEKLFADSGMSVGIARIFAQVGRYLPLDIHYAVGNFIGNCLRNEPIVIKGDGRPYRSYMYADDLVEWLFAVMESGVSGRPYNVGSEEGVTIEALARRVRCITGSKSEIVIRDRPDGSVSERYYPTESRARKELLMALRYDLDAAIGATVDFLKND